MKTNEDLKFLFTPTSTYCIKARYEGHRGEYTNNGLRHRTVFIFRAPGKKGRKIEFYGVKLTDHCFRFRYDKEYNIGQTHGMLVSISDGETVFYRQGNKIIRKELATGLCQVINEDLLKRANRHAVQTRKALYGVTDPGRRQEIAHKMFLKYSLSNPLHAA